ncbi:hypothetical protein B0H16DRAFT_1724142 [Mycena metata]|uniref:Uncharacterized protein n=1 Tax=Mycena metata TaxID=1033252 RepID=A0AAD7IVL5_9AGAR|nr:hypothetical protein B0H16DRAFT_1724142 [Mycena metata]
MLCTQDAHATRGDTYPRLYSPTVRGVLWAAEEKAWGGLCGGLRQYGRVKMAQRSSSRRRTRAQAAAGRARCRYYARDFSFHPDTSLMRSSPPHLFLFLPNLLTSSQRLTLKPSIFHSSESHVRARARQADHSTLRCFSFRAQCARAVGQKRGAQAHVAGPYCADVVKRSRPIHRCVFGSLSLPSYNSQSLLQPPVKALCWHRKSRDTLIPSHRARLFLLAPRAHISLHTPDGDMRRSSAFGGTTTSFRASGSRANTPAYSSLACQAGVACNAHQLGTPQHLSRHRTFQCVPIRVSRVEDGVGPGATHSEPLQRIPRTQLPHSPLQPPHYSGPPPAVHSPSFTSYLPPPSRHPLQLYTRVLQHPPHLLRISESTSCCDIVKPGVVFRRHYCLLPVALWSCLDVHPSTSGIYEILFIARHARYPYRPKPDCGGSTRLLLLFHHLARRLRPFELPSIPSWSITSTSCTATSAHPPQRVYIDAVAADLYCRPVYFTTSSPTPVFPVIPPPHLVDVLHRHIGPPRSSVYIDALVLEACKTRPVYSNGPSPTPLRFSCRSAHPESSSAIFPAPRPSPTPAPRAHPTMPSPTLRLLQNLRRCRVVHPVRGLRCTATTVCR